MTTATDLPDLGSLRDEQQALRAQLAKLRRRLRLQLALEFAVDAALALVAIAAVLVLLDWAFRLGLPARLALLGLSMTAVLAYLVVRAMRHWRMSGPDELSLALTLDRHRPGTGQQIADVLQLPDLLGDPAKAGVSSPAMVRLAVRRACEALAASDWHTLWNARRSAAFVAALLAGLLVPAAFALVAPEAARLSVARWLFGSSERWPQKTYLSVEGLDGRGRLLAPRDERVVLDVRSDAPAVEAKGGKWTVPGRGEPLTLGKKPAAPTTPKEVLVRERTAEGATRNGVMTATAPGRFRYELPQSAASSTIDLTGGDDWLGPLKVERVDRPSLATIKLRVKEPGSSSGDFRTIDDTRQHLVFLPDTEVEMTLVGTEPIASVRVNAHPATMPKPERVDEKSFLIRWTLREATSLEFLLTSGSTGLVSKPAFLSIGILKDREPRVTLRAVGIGLRVTPVATIPLTLAATDDFGLASIRLQADRATSEEGKSEPITKRQTIPLPLAAEPGRPVLDHQTRHDVVLQTDPPRIGAVLRFQGEAEDRSARRPQVGRSSVVQVQVVSPDELFYDILIRQRAERAKFLAILETAEKQAPILARSPTSDDFLKMTREQNSGSRQLDQIAGRIADTLQEMKLNQIGSPKAHRLLQDGVIDPIRALNAGPMNELRGVMQALAGTAPRAGADREGAKRLHGEVVTRMKAILEQMSQWESFVDVVNQVAEVIKMQQKVLQETEKARETRTREVFDEKP